MNVEPDHVRDYGPSAAIVLAVLVEASQGAPVVVARTEVGRACGLHRLTVGRALERLRKARAIKIDPTPRKGRLVIYVMDVAPTCHSPNGATPTSPTRVQGGVLARLDSLRALLDAVG
jgi:hypothetical protein